ncbi:AMP-binding protein, partial [Pseudomonas arsenicoxydans]
IVPAAVRMDGQQLWHYFTQHAVDVFDSTPIQLQGLLEAGLGSSSGYQPQLALIGGDAISPLLWSRLQHITTSRFINVYGPTECTVDATACPIDAALSQPSIGHPIANTQLYILDPQGQPVPIGVTGQIHIAGAGVARGYLNRPALTAERFVTNPFSPDPHARMYCTGDLGRWLNDGSIEYLGRNDFLARHLAEYMLLSAFTTLDAPMANSTGPRWHRRWPSVAAGWDRRYLCSALCSTTVIAK